MILKWFMLYKYNIIEMETDIDYIHILLEYSPKHSISNIIKNLKQYSTYKMWKFHNLILSRHYWKQKNIVVRWLFCL